MVKKAAIIFGIMIIPIFFGVFFITKTAFAFQSPSLIHLWNFEGNYLDSVGNANLSTPTGFTFE